MLHSEKIAIRECNTKSPIPEQNDINPDSLVSPRIDLNQFYQTYLSKNPGHDADSYCHKLFSKGEDISIEEKSSLEPIRYDRETLILFCEGMKEYLSVDTHREFFSNLVEDLKLP